MHNALGPRGWTETEGSVKEQLKVRDSRSAWKAPAIKFSRRFTKPSQTSQEVSESGASVNVD